MTVETVDEKQCKKTSIFRTIGKKNMSKGNTRYVHIYLKIEEKNKSAKSIFSVRSKTFNIKVWQQWKYEDNLCILWHVKEENIDHFVICSAYSN